MADRTTSRGLTGRFAAHLTAILVVLSFYGLEIVRASLSGDSLPVGPLYFPLGGLVVLAVYVSMTVLLIRLKHVAPGLQAAFVSLLSVLLVGVKLLPVPDASTAAITGLYLAGPIAAVALLDGARFRNPDHRRAWVVILTLLAIVSTDGVRIAWRWTGGWDRRRMWSGLALAALLGLAAWTFPRLWPKVQEALVIRWKISLTTAGVALILIVVLWHVTWTPRILQQGTTGFTPVEMQTPNEPLLPEDRAVRDLPNILVISIDTLRWDLVPPRADHLELPNLRKLRRDSLVFEKAFSTSGWTLPAHASLFSGVPPIDHGAMLPQNWIYRTRPLYPRYLREIGYRTASFTDAGYVNKVYGFCRGIELCWEQKEPFPDYPHTGYVPGSLELASLILDAFDRGPSLAFRPAPSVTGAPPRTRALRYFDRNLEASREWLGTRNSTKPFYVFLHTFEVHDAWRVYPEPYRQLQGEVPELAPAVSPSGMSDEADRALKQRAKKQLYEYGIEAVDRSLGQFLGWLKQRNLYDDTLIVFLSDHGEGFGLEHGITGHEGHVREVLTRVPLWIKFPQGRFGTKSVEPFVQLSDVFPIIFRELGIKRPTKRFTGTPKNGWTPHEGLSVPERTLIPTSVAWKIDANRNLPPKEKRVKIGIRGSKFKLEKIQGRDTGTFWRVAPDTLRQTPVSPGEVPVNVRRRLQGQWKDHLEPYDRYPNPFLRDDPTLSDPMIDNLRGLGYLP